MIKQLLLAGLAAATLSARAGAADADLDLEIAALRLGGLAKTSNLANELERAGDAAVGPQAAISRALEKHGEARESPETDWEARLASDDAATRRKALAQARGAIARLDSRRQGGAVRRVIAIAEDGAEDEESRALAYRTLGAWLPDLLEERDRRLSLDALRACLRAAPSLGRSTYRADALSGLALDAVPADQRDALAAILRDVAGDPKASADEKSRAKRLLATLELKREG